MSNSKDYISSEEECVKNHTAETVGPNCNAVWDFVTCWPSTPSGVVARKRCPAIFGADSDKYVYKQCGHNGSWARSELWKGFGHSDYSECVGHLSPVIKEAFDLQNKQTTEEKTKVVNVVENSEHGSLITLTLVALSFIFLASALICITCILPKNIRAALNYKVWRNLLCAVLLETTVILVLEIGLLLYAPWATTNPGCQSILVLLHYSDSVSTMWFLIQTHFQQLTANSGRMCMSGYVTYILIGWGFPTIPTAIWTVTSSLSFKIACWVGYEVQPIVWILHIPKILMVLTALFFLLKAFTRFSKNTELLKTSCCYHRLFLEAIGCVVYMVFVIVITLANTLNFFIRHNNPLLVFSSVLYSIKGTVISILLGAFNADLRTMLERKVRRISRQELVSSATADENEL